MAVEPNRWGIIYNPKAGSRKTQKRWNEIRSYMENRKVVFDYVQSEGFGSVERLARTLANNGYRTIVIVGGDGAINDAINGIMTSMVEERQISLLESFLMVLVMTLPNIGGWMKIIIKQR